MSGQGAITSVGFGAGAITTGGWGGGTAEVRPEQPLEPEIHATVDLRPEIRDGSLVTPKASTRTVVLRPEMDHPNGGETPEVAGEDVFRPWIVRATRKREDE